jgi:DNA-binding HxlR family transcriptional regulator
VVGDALLTVADPGTATRLPAGGPNPLAVTLGLLGDEWNLQILRHALLGATRYGQWRDRLPISHSVLTGRLGWLTRMGMLERVPYQERPRRYEYLPTKRSHDLWPVLTAIWTWEATWVDDHADPLPALRHRACGEIATPRLECGNCGRPTTARDVEGGFGPSGTWERSVPEATSRRRSLDDDGLQFPETMALLGNRWSSALIGAAFQGIQRFNEFEQALTAPPTVVADRLRILCGLGVLRAEPSAERADWPRYRLTAKGLAFFPVVILTIDWGERWFRAPEGPSIVYRHRACGQSFAPWLACDVCDKPLAPDQIEVVSA